MKFLKIAISAVAIAGFASAASAQDTGAYINVGVDAYEFDAYTLSGKIGYKFTKYLGVEGQAAVGIIDKKDTVRGFEAKAGVDTSFGAFGVVRIPTGKGLNLIGRAGYHATQLSAAAGNVEIDVDTDGFAFGAGSEYIWDDVNGIRLEYTYMDNDSNEGSDVFTLSYVRNF